MLYAVIAGVATYAATDSGPFSLFAFLIVLVLRMSGEDFDQQDQQKPAHAPRPQGRPSAAALAALKAKR